MRIAHCIHGLGLGGAQKVIASLVRGCRGSSLRHFVYSCNGGVFQEEVEEAGAVVRIIPRLIPKLDPLWAARLANAMRSDHIDLVHTHLFGDSLHGSIAARTAGGLPLIMTLHSTIEILKPLQLLGYRWLIPRCSRAVACSNSVRDSFVAALRHRTDELLTIRNGIEVPRLRDYDLREKAELKRSLGVDPTSLLLLAVGRQVEEKGYRYLVAAFATLCRDSGCDARLVFLGEGPLRQALERQVETAGLTGRIVFAGVRQDIWSLLSVADVVVFSSLSEGLPIALLEAMAAARCIVGTDVPGIVEAVRDDHEALIVQTKSVDQLSGALLEVARSSRLRERLGKGARSRFLETFSAERMVNRYERLYDEILSG